MSRQKLHSYGPGTFLFTSESVSEGHPDKICDRISDAIVDAYLAEDPYSRCAVETLATTNRVVIAGEIRGADTVTRRIPEIVAGVVKEIGYDQDGFSWRNLEVHNYLHEQSADIAQGVDASGEKDEGAGDQGIMFGYASRESEPFMPAPIYYSHRILKALADARHSGELPQLGPDAKCQVTLAYRNEKPFKAHSVLVSTQHNAGVSQEEVKELIRPYILRVLPQGWMCDEEEFFVNPTGNFVIGGPDGDAGLTGRKIIVDTYGGAAPHGGGAFSGKDPTKVDRSAAYAARYLAKNVVASGLAERCTIQLAYAIGVSRPLGFYVNGHDTAVVPENALVDVLQELMNLSPRGIREHLKLNRAIYQPTASYGHFGRTPREGGFFSWEKTDLVEELQRSFSGALRA